MLNGQQWLFAWLDIFDDSHHQGWLQVFVIIENTSQPGLSQDLNIAEMDLLRARSMVGSFIIYIYIFTTLDMYM